MDGSRRQWPYLFRRSAEVYACTVLPRRRDRASAQPMDTRERGIRTENSSTSLHRPSYSTVACFEAAPQILRCNTEWACAAGDHWCVRAATAAGRCLTVQARRGRRHHALVRLADLAVQPKDILLPLNLSDAPQALCVAPRAETWAGGQGRERAMEQRTSRTSTAMIPRHVFVHSFLPTLTDLLPS